MDGWWKLILIGINKMPNLHEKIIRPSVGTVTALKAIDITNYDTGIDGVVMVGAGTSAETVYIYNKTSTATGDDDLVVAPTAGSGRWIKVASAGTNVDTWDRITGATNYLIPHVAADHIGVTGTRIAKIWATDLNTNLLTIDNIQIDANTISSTTGNLNIEPIVGSSVIIDSHFNFDGATLNALSDNNTIITAYGGKNITIESVTFDGGVVAGITTLTMSSTLTNSSLNTAGGIVQTSGTGVFSTSVDLPTATTIGTAYIYRVSGTDVSLLDGGTNASLTANTGGIVYSGASALAILSGTATANQVLLSGSTAAPAWSTATYPATTTINQILYSSAANTITGLASAASSILVTNGSSVPSLATDIPTAVTIGTAYIYRVAGTDVAVTDGGTGLSAWTQYGLVYASTTTVLSQITDTTAGKVLITQGSGAPAFSTTLPLVHAGSIGAVVDFITSTNTTAAVLNGGTGIYFNFTASDTNVYGAGRISCVAEGTWSVTAADRDSSFIFSPVVDGVVTNRVWIDSRGYVGIGASPEWVLDISQDGVDVYSLAQMTNVNSTAIFRFGVGGNAVLNTSLRNNAFILNNGASSLILGTNDTPRMTMLSSGYVGFAVSSITPSSPIDIEWAGTVTSTVDFLEITNTANTISMTGTGTAIVLKQTAYDALTPTQYDCARISTVTESNWLVSDATTRNSYVSISTSYQGTVAEKIRITSTGKLSNAAQVPTVDSSMFSILAAGANTATTGLLAQGISVINTNTTDNNTAGIFFNTALDTTFGSVVCRFIDRSGSPKSNLYFNTYGGTLRTGMAIDNNSFVSMGLENVTPLYPLDLWYAGVAGTENVMFNLRFKTAATAGTEAAIRFEHTGSDTVNHPSGMLSVSSDATWTSTALTQDSTMHFKTTLDGTLTDWMGLNSKGVTRLGVGTLDTTASAVHTIFNGTAPAAAVTNGIQIFSIDSASATASLGLYLEEAVVDIGTFTASHKVAVYINGAWYHVSLDAV